MAEHWKSTPKYFCKDCSTYVRDTKLERANHEATSRHQHARERTLRGMHRRHEQDEREKERARREVERVTGVVSGTTGAGVSRKESTADKSGLRDPGGDRTGMGAPTPQGGTKGNDKEKQKQLEQLVALGVDIPGELRGDIAMAGQWQVVETKVLPEDGLAVGRRGISGITGGGAGKRAGGDGEDDEDKEKEREVDEAVKGLFEEGTRGGERKKRRKVGGRDPYAERKEVEGLDALLGGFGCGEVKKEENDDEGVKKEEDGDGWKVNREEGGDGGDDGSVLKREGEGDVKVKKEEEDGGDYLAGVVAGKDEEKVPAVVFKKRKPKNIRQK